MNIITNEGLIKRNSAIGKVTSLVGMLMLVGGLIASFQIQDPEIVMWLWAAFIFGFVLSQVGIYFGNRWGRIPRLDQIIDKNLKGLGREYSIYHYMTPAAHLLVGPAGVWTILPYYQSGRISFTKGRWRASGGGFLQAYMRIFGQESIGKPDMDARVEIDSLRKYLFKILAEDAVIPEIRALLVFTHPKVDLALEDAPLPAITPREIKDSLRAAAKANPLPKDTLSALQAALPQVGKET